MSRAEELVASPHEGQSLVILYGQRYAQVNSGGSIWMAYEQEGVDSRHRVLNIRGDVVEMDTQELKQVFPAEG